MTGSSTPPDYCPKCTHPWQAHEARGCLSCRCRQAPPTGSSTPREARRVELRRLMVNASDTTEAQMLGWLAEYDDLAAALAAQASSEAPTCPDCEHEWRDHNERGCEVRYAARLPLEDGVCSCRTVRASSEAEGLDVDLDTLDRWQEDAERIGVDAVRFFDRAHTKAETEAALRDLGRRATILGHALWMAGHRVVDGKWTPPTRYMRDNAARLAESRHGK